MRRRSRASSKLAKARSRKTVKRRTASKDVHRPGASAGHEAKVARLTRERDEALERETATAEVLKVISSSPGDLTPVFEAMLKNATRLCEAKFGLLYLYEEGRLRFGAAHDVPPAFAEARGKEPFTPPLDSNTGRVVATKQAVQIADVAATQSYSNRYPSVVAAVELGGVRTALSVPMLKENALIGVISIYRKEVRPFTDKQIALVTNFAAQAVIAIENARLLNELQQSLEQQTATSDVLGVISKAPGELQAVFDIILKNANRLCDAKFSALFIYENGLIRVPSHADLPPALAEHFHKRNDQPPIPGTAIETLIKTKRLIHIADQRESPEGLSSPATTLAGARTYLAVPLLNDGDVIGAIAIYRQEVRPFTDKQIELVKNFAAQAVIAIENARLLNELRESLQQQTATADVLKVISTSPGELEPVFQAMLENAVRICEAKFGTLFRFEGHAYRAVATHNAPQELMDEYGRHGLREPTPGGILDRMLRTKQVCHTADYAAESVHGTAARFGGARSIVCVPMLKDNVLIGAFSIYRQEVRPFTDKQIALLENFAAQAVIAIENARLLSELRESLEQQTATSEVLKVISSSPGDLQPVFDAMLANATRICEAKFGTLYLYDGEAYRTASMCNAPPAFAEYRRRGPIHPGPGTGLGRIARTKQLVHVADITAEQSYIDRDPLFVTAVELGGFRALLAVPMLKEGNLIGAILIYRQEVGAFSDKQIALVQNFANQAVIAIENTRLLNELRQSLEQQTATADVLRVISSSPGELEPVFQAMLGNATRICEAKFGTLFRFDGTNFHPAAQFNTPAVLLEAQTRRGPFQPPPGSQLDRVMRTKRVSHTADYVAEPVHGLAVVAGARSLIAVPMLKEGELVGAIVIYRQEVRPFTDKQIELVQNFAAQAVIAIENTRLLNELRQRTSDLTESLEQQTATSEVLKIISSSPGELEPMFDTMLANATRLCEANFGLLQLYENGLFRVGAMHNPPPPFAQAIGNRGSLIKLGPLTGTGRAAATKQLVHISNYAEDPAYKQRDPATVMLVELAGARTLIVVPMLKDEELIGTIAIFRQEVRPFTEKQIALVTNFAAQAVIAIENTRLLSELRQSLQQQTATADVLKVISRSTFNLQTVLDTLVESAARLCEAEMSSIVRLKGTAYEHAASCGMAPELHEYMRNFRLERGRGTVAGRVALEGQVVQVVDIETDSDYVLVDAMRRVGTRTILGAPLLREGVPIGVIVLMRKAVRPFTDKQIELVTTFADQAVIAIENVRLFDEIQDKSRQLEEASQHKSQFLANMSHELRTPLNAILGYTELMADGAYGEPSEKMVGILQRLEANGKHLLGLINDVLDLSKIEAGQLVLELSDYCIQDIAQTVRSTLEPLAADKKLGFKVEVASQLPPGHGDGRRLTQVLINLVGNAIKFTDVGEVAIKAEAHHGSFHVSVRDTGPGISSADQARLFQEFQQADNAITKKKGGTGLGLAISKRIIEMHGGRIWVESQPGQGSTFTFTLPVIVERQVEAA
jgi:GAF domain-containing protein